MRIIQSNVNIVYPKLYDYRKKFINAEDTLSEHFMPATLLAIPDQVQDEVPRAIIQSKGGHSVLNVSLVVSSLLTRYDGNYSNDWQTCSEYIRKRCDSVYNMVDRLTDQGKTFTGIITNIEFPEMTNNPIEVLKKSLLVSDGRNLDNPYDFSCKLTYVYRERYFINILLENTRRMDAIISDVENRHVFSNEEQILSATIDVNDRYIANKDSSYKSSKQAFDTVLDITSDIINNKIEKLIRKGEFVNA